MPAMSMTARVGLRLGVVAAALVGGSTASRAQGVFDPYRSESRDYAAAVRPITPNNLALPGAAREAGGFSDSGGGGSRFNTFERDVDGLGTRSIGIGSPYFDAYRGSSSPFYRPYVPGSTPVGKGEVSAKQQQAYRELYAAALREPDPVKRAQLLRGLKRPAGSVARYVDGPATSSAAADPGMVAPSDVPFDRAPARPAVNPSRTREILPGTRRVPATTAPTTPAASTTTATTPRRTPPVDPIFPDTKPTPAPSTPSAKPATAPAPTEPTSPSR